MTGLNTAGSRFIIALVLLAGMLPLAASAQTPEASPGAKSGPQFVLRPAGGEDGDYFTLEAEPGSAHTLTAVLGNAGTAPLSLRTYAADAFTLVNGGFGVHAEDDPVEAVGAWLDYAPETLDLAPDEAVERDIVVHVPDDAEPGQYIAGLVLRTAEPVAIEGSALFNQIVRKSVAILITVPGETEPALALGEAGTVVGPAGVRLSVPVENTGNVLLKPAGEVVLTDAAGAVAFIQQVAMGSVYAGMETTLEVPLPTALPEGDYTLTLSLEDRATSAAASTDGQSLTLSREVEAEAPLSIAEASVAPTPDADNVQFAAVSVIVDNREAPVDGVRVLLGVSHDGEPVEEFALAQSVTLQQGETSLEQRYIPVDGWSAGEWTFTVTVQSVDPRSGAEATLLSEDVVDTIVVGGD